MTEYSNPRTRAVVPHWPSGGKRVTATFEIECDSRRGERATRITTGKPKKITYGRTARIMDGDDRKVYVAVLASEYDLITVFRGDFQGHETIFPDNPRYDAVRKLLAVPQ